MNEILLGLKIRAGMLLGELIALAGVIAIALACYGVYVIGSSLSKRIWHSKGDGE